jgi:hypothetical protein
MAKECIPVLNRYESVLILGQASSARTNILDILKEMGCEHIVTSPFYNDDGEKLGIKLRKLLPQERF